MSTTPLKILVITDPDNNILDFEWDEELHPTLYTRFKSLTNDPQNYPKDTTIDLFSIHIPTEDFRTDLEGYMESNFLRLIAENDPFYTGRTV